MGWTRRRLLRAQVVARAGEPYRVEQLTCFLFALNAFFYSSPFTTSERSSLGIWPRYYGAKKALFNLVLPSSGISCNWPFRSSFFGYSGRCCGASDLFGSSLALFFRHVSVALSTPHDCIVPGVDRMTEPFRNMTSLWYLPIPLRHILDLQS